VAPVIEEKQRNMCRKIRIQKIGWDEMFETLLAADRNGYAPVSKTWSAIKTL
jgi:hypothetical protein